MVATVTRAGMLFDFAAEQAEGFLATEAEADLGFTHAQFAKATRALRLILADDSINLICLQQGFGKPKRYHLVGTFEKAGPWVRERMRGIESQLESVLALSTSLVNASDGRTTEGKKARLVARHVGRLVEDLGEIDGRIPTLR
jgi:hypothetical protein